MKFIQNLFWKHNLNKVFTPTTVAKLTYVERRTLEDDLIKYIRMPGMQIVLYGHSGCGKSTLISNKLAKLRIPRVLSRCQSDSTMNDLILQAFDSLNIFYNSENTSTRKRTIKSDLKAKYLEIGGLISASKSSEESKKQLRLLPPQLTPQRLAEFMGAAKCIWQIEDFHKISDSEKKKLSDIMKIFLDSSEQYEVIKIICIGAVGTARELVEYDKNLRDRVAEIFVPLLSDDELKKIAIKGFNYMNLIPENDSIDKIVYYSNNIASVCHQLCYDICFNKNIERTMTFSKFFSDEDLKKAVGSYVRRNTDTFTKIYDKISSEAIHKEILNSIMNLDKFILSQNELISEINKTKKVEPDFIKEFLIKLTTIEYDETLRVDKISKKYYFSNPFFHTFIKMQLALEKQERLENRRRRKAKYQKKLFLFNIQKEPEIFIEEYIKNMEVLNSQIFTLKEFQEKAYIKIEKEKE